MSFENAFEKVMNAGGFDVIVGNPPWGASFTKDGLAYLRGKFQRVIARMIDSYVYFLDQAIRKGKADGLVGFVVPSTVLNQVDAKPVRKLLLSRGLSALISLGSGIFGPKVLNTSTILITGSRDKGDTLILDDLSGLPLAERAIELNRKKTSKWKPWKSLVQRDTHLTFFINLEKAALLLMRLREQYPTLGSLLPAGIQRGISPDLVEAHVVSKSTAKREKLESELLRTSVSGPQIKRYQNWSPDQFIIYTTRETLIKNYPNIYKYLGRFRHLNSCPEVRDAKHPWWALHRPRASTIFDAPKIIGLTTSKTIELIYDSNSSAYVTDAMYVFQSPHDWEPWSLIAILQSKLFLFLYRTANQGESRVIPQVKASKLEPLPIPKCDVSHSSSKRLSGIAKQLLDSKQHWLAAKTDKDKNYYSSKCAAFDHQIDALVYELYDLAEEEIQIVETSIREFSGSEL
jgi:hypothetical protein